MSTFRKVFDMANRGIRGLVLLYLAAISVYFGLAALERGDNLVLRLGIVLALAVATVIPRGWTPDAWRRNTGRRRLLIVVAPLAAAAILATLGMLEGLEWRKRGIEIWYFGPMAGLILAARWWLPEEASPWGRSAMLLLPLAGLILTVLLILLGALSLSY